jgi:hypothetical protein
MSDRIFSRYWRGASFVLCLASLAIANPATAANDPDCTRPGKEADCGVHNMMLVGTKAPYLSHLPMFHSEHRFQIIMEVRFDNGDERLDQIYFEDRSGNPEVKMYTVAPHDLFKVARIFDPGEKPERSSFAATVFRGHLERGGVEIDRLDGIDVTVTRVIYARELEPDAEKSRDLSYILFGSDDGFFLAHKITQAPDFDQLVAVDLGGHAFTADDLMDGVIITVPDRDNTGKDRLRVGENVAATATIGDVTEGVELTIGVVAEPYFEDSELMMPPDFESSALEKEAGF